MKKYLLISMIILLLFPISIKANELVEVTLSKCVDGDTAWFNYKNKSTKFRFLAIDTPESTNEIEAFGKEASNYTCSLLENADKIEIEFDPKAQSLDKYSRYLVWVFVDNNLLQEKIISKGLGEVKYLYDDYKYTDILIKEQSKAKVNKIGIWSETDYNWLYVIISVILIILYFTNKKYRNKINRKIKKVIKKKTRSLS